MVFCFEKVANSIRFVYGPCIREQSRVQAVFRAVYGPCTWPLHSRVHSLYMAVCTVMYTGRVHGRVWAMSTAMYGPCTRIHDRVHHRYTT